MTDIIQEIQQAAAAAVKEIFSVEIAPEDLPVQETRKEFTGDFTLVVFPLTRHKLGNPQQIGEKLGEALKERLEAIEDFNVIKGFLNLSLSDEFWQKFLADTHNREQFFRLDTGQGQTVVVEYCSPNTNKPLHLGHLRNIVLGYALTQVLEANGFKVVPTCLFNDRGTNISKSMYAWLKAGKDDTPESTGMKGDKLVGDYYVAFNGMLAEEIDQLMATGLTRDEAERRAPSTKAVNEMTIRWENEDPEIRALWEKMNSWVYEAFHQTFERLGVHFDRFYYESEVYQRGKESVSEGLEKGIFEKTEDGAVEVDLTPDGLDKKTLLRANGTSLYITQDLAVAADKYEEFKMDRSIYVVGNEQDYHFKVLFLILKKLEKPYSEGLYHLSYGMVDLPSGKMKSREGTTVEADDLMDEMIGKAAEETAKLGKTEEMSGDEQADLHRKLGLSALKYFLVKVDPKKRMLFDPNESIDLKGHTGPFIQYSYARIRSLLRKADEAGIVFFSADQSLEQPLLDVEKLLLRQIFRYREVLKEAAETYNPALIANYAYELAKEYNRFYQEAPILKSTDPGTSSFRLTLSDLCGQTLRQAMTLLGIEMPERM